MTLNLASMAIKSSGLTEIILTVTTHEEVVFSLQPSPILKHLLPVQISIRSSAVYLPPMSALPDFEAHTSSIEHLISSTNPTSILLCGDYNLPLIKWSKSNQGLFASGTISNISTHLVDSFSYYNFYQLNQVPNARGCLLDLVFSSFDTPTVQLANTPIVSPDSYHPPLFISFPLPTLITAQDSHKYRDYKLADYKSMLLYLGSFDWENTFSLYSVDDSAVVFNDALLSSINKFVPIKVFSPSKFPKWTSTILKNLIITKKKAHAVYKRSKSLSDYLVFSEYRAKCKRQSKVDYSAHIRHTEEALSSSPSKFWKFTFNSSAFQLPPFTGSSDYLSYELPSDIMFTVEDVFSALKSLKNTYSNGPDGISTQCLRSLDLGIFPKVWKIFSIAPVLKSGDASDIQNYRPISIIPHIGKLFESIVYSKIKRSLNHLIISEQHGFRSHKSTVTSGVAFSSYLSEVIEHRGQVDVIFTDFNKAFDTVDHNCLIMVLKSLGIGNPLLSWLHSYITGRKQFIKFKNAISELAVIPSGVPQGGHLSPLLFILFVNSITKWITKAKLLLFADDIKIFLKIDNLNQYHILQSELDIFASWAYSIGLCLNINKCHVMSFSRQRSPIYHNYSLNGTSLNRVFLYKDLGIHYSPSLNFEHHINVTVGYCKRIKEVRNITLLRNKIVKFNQKQCYAFIAEDAKKLKELSNIPEVAECVQPIHSPTNSKSFRASELTDEVKHGDH
ncbi:uncharacterized protein LOC132947567 [Metopolophium dirhodum]|uniref:uncharacterized protein LOC132947567 n=1 Tax=Metopolophium dirhodum TaxID=44670 RepID=UPI00298F4A01|nr:uncharacterized protein LOC132947567 [Metopolophium dirhodum]